MLEERQSLDKHIFIHLNEEGRNIYRVYFYFWIILKKSKSDKPLDIFKKKHISKDRTFTSQMLQPI